MAPFHPGFNVIPAFACIMTKAQMHAGQGCLVPSRPTHITENTYA
jgi:oxalate decarboxylase/phosphoglucose isomerase-like protein (cupin superfamily)